MSQRTSAPRLRIGDHQISQGRPLADPSLVMVVSGGPGHVFAVRCHDGVPYGARQHLFEVQAGDALFGMALPAGEGVCLLAAAIPGAQLLALDGAQLREPSGGFESQIERWVSHLTSALNSPLPPRKPHHLAPGQQVSLEAGESIRPSEGLLWVTIVDGRARFSDLESGSVDSDSGELPLSAAGWLRASTPLRIMARGTPAKPGPNDLASFNRVVLAAISARLDAVDRAAVERSRQRSAVDERALAAALDSLLTSFDGSQLLQVRPARTLGPTIAALQLIGRRLRVPIQVPPAGELQQLGADEVESIAAASRLRTREVALDGSWWKHDSGPLLAYRKDSREPVVLLPSSTGRYVLIDPVDGTRTRVTREVAERLAPAALAFNAPLPERRLRAGDLLRLGLRWSGRDAVELLVAGLLGGLLALAVPIGTGLLFDRVIPASDRRELVTVGLALLVNAFAIGCFQVSRGIATQRMAGRADAAIQPALWDRLLTLPVPFFRRYSSGDLATRAMGISVIRRVLAGVVAASLLSAGFSVFSFVALFVFDAQLALASTALLLLVLAATAIAWYLQLRWERRLAHLRGRLASLVLDMLTGISKLHVAGAEARAFAVWSRLYSASVRPEVRSIGVSVGVLYGVLPLAALVVVFATVAARSGTALTPGTFLAFNAALTQVIAALVAVSTALTATIPVVPLYERIRPILEATPEVAAVKAAPGELQGDVEVANLTFRYAPGAPPVLRGVSFHARPGEFVALVGPSGSGKSTVLRLLLGFENAESGTVRYDGQDLASLDPRGVRRQLGVVLQTGKLVPGSVYQNIVGSGRFTMEEAWEAAAMAGFDADIRAMPMGMHTMVMEGGSSLSGGQRQRLLIARAIVSRPRLLLFDEATSALDNLTQAIVSASLESLQATRIVIAHRLSTIRNADTIHVMQAGRIVESGIYEDLMASGGVFTELAARQVL